MQRSHTLSSGRMERWGIESCSSELRDIRLWSLCFMCWLSSFTSRKFTILFHLPSKKVDSLNVLRTRIGTHDINALKYFCAFKVRL